MSYPYLIKVDIKIQKFINYHIVPLIDINKNIPIFQIFFWQIFP